MSARNRLSTDRRTLLKASAATLAALAPAAALARRGDMDAIRKAVDADHAASVQRLQEWIVNPTIAAENHAAAPSRAHDSGEFDERVAEAVRC